jgi:hypothetical protein
LNGPVKKNATGSAEFVFDLELADEVEISPRRKRLDNVRSKPSEKNDAAGKNVLKTTTVKTQNRQTDTMGL